MVREGISELPGTLQTVGRIQGELTRRSHRELEDVLSGDRGRMDALSRLEELVDDPERMGREKIIPALYGIFFPEGRVKMDSIEDEIESFRSKRVLKEIQSCDDPVTDASNHLLFTSNALLTIPPKGKDIHDLDMDPDLARKALEVAVKEEQLYWYDHPVQMGAPPEVNEVLYGLRELDRALLFERERGNLSAGAKVCCLLSVSVTHAGLHELSRPYLEDQLKRHARLECLDIYVVTEEDTESLVRDVLVPFAEELNQTGAEVLEDIFGVDGEYGRHYTFLKAVAALWRSAVNPELKATFKIDLDQVFPQEELVAGTGASALEHLATPLWGGRAVDSEGREVELGLVAGALVNQSDIDKGIFTPDVTFPEDEPKGDACVFNSKIPQALSTVAEMMTRYEGETWEGKALQRIHVTGGTNGIRVDALHRYRPFTPGCIGRAEDQAYILSVLHRPVEGRYLRYVHRPGLIMRHDKKAFASLAMEAAKTGKVIGDYIRILFFSAYASVLPGGRESVKEEIDPFTGSFVTPLPVTLAFLRLILTSIHLFRQGDEDAGGEHLEEGAPRIKRALDYLEKQENLKKVYERESGAWDLYYRLCRQMEGRETSARKRAQEQLLETRLELD